MFAQIHFLTDYSAALQNRDQNGLAKRAPYGDAIRQRISSQCLKAALRDAERQLFCFDPAAGDMVADRMADLAVRLGEGMAVRSRIILPGRLTKQLTAALAGSGIEVKPYVEALAAMFAKKSGDEEGEEAAAEPEGDADQEEAGAAAGALKQPIVLGEHEIAALSAVISSLARDGTAPKDLAEALGFAKKKPAAGGKKGKAPPKAAVKLSAGSKEAVANFHLMRSQPGLDAQLFGRFSTANLFESVGAAVHVAHLMTVHPIMSTPDYFTVQDMDLPKGDHGASHANTTEIASGLFYGFVVVDLRGLARNLPGANAADLAAIVAWLVRAVHQVEPSAKMGSTAAYGNTHEMLLELGQRQPRSLIGAYQRAIRPEILGAASLSEEAVARLRAKTAEENVKSGRPALQVLLSERAAEPLDGGLAAYEALAADFAWAIDDAISPLLAGWRAK